MALKRAREPRGTGDERVTKRPRSSSALLAHPEGSRPSKSTSRSKPRSRRDPEDQGGIGAGSDSDSDSVESSSNDESGHALAGGVSSSSAESLDGNGDGSDAGRDETSDEVSTSSDEDDTSSSGSSESSLTAIPSSRDMHDIRIRKSSTLLKTPISQPIGDTDLQSRLSAFLPALHEANTRLLDPGEAAGRRIDDVDVGEEHYIEMDLGLGVLKEKRRLNPVRDCEVRVQERSSSGSEGGDSEDGESSGVDRRGLLEGEMLAKLKGENRGKGSRPGIEEISPG